MKTFNEKMWDLLIEYALAEGVLHEHDGNDAFEWAHITDENGRKYRWYFHKTTGTIEFFTCA